MKTALLVNGPNLGLLGIRQPEIYGTTTLKEIELNVQIILETRNVSLTTYQSNSEGDLISFLNENFVLASQKKLDLAGVIFNFGAYSHTSIALRDAVAVFKDLKVPRYEVHLSNIFAREEFRKHSHMSAVANGVVCGLGAYGYSAAAQMLIDVN